MCHMSRVTCHMSRVTCHMSCVTCQFFFLIKWWSLSVEGLSSTGLPCLVFHVKMILIISITFFINFINQTQVIYTTPELFDFKQWQKQYFVKKIKIIHKFSRKTTFLFTFYELYRIYVLNCYAYMTLKLKFSIFDFWPVTWFFVLRIAKLNYKNLNYLNRYIFFWIHLVIIWRRRHN